MRPVAAARAPPPRDQHTTLTPPHNHATAAPPESLLTRARKLLQITIRNSASGGCTVAVPYRWGTGNLVGGNIFPNFVTLGRGSPRCNGDYYDSWGGGYYGRR